MKPKTERFTIALAGNPNSGKTTTFNNLTGTRQKVGNWPGVTVEKKLGHISHKGHELTIVDLPGTYSLTAFSIEEIVARNFVLNEKPDLVVDVIDASNLERSLYLATQLRELDIPVLFVLNMMDVAAARGHTVDTKKLSELLDVPVVITVGNKNQGTADLIDAIIDAAKNCKAAPVHRRVKYTRDIEEAVARVREKLNASVPCDFPYNQRWTAIKLLENDQEVAKTVEKLLKEKAVPVFEQVQRQRKHLSDLFDDEPEILMTEQRYGFIAGIVREVVKSAPQTRADMSRSIDLVLTNRYLGFPLFLFFIWAMFQLTFTLGAYPMEWIEAGVEMLSEVLVAILPAGLFADMIVNGMLAGVGAVIVFLPNILILFFCIAIFEDTGYMARAAFLMDKVMHLMGLHGKSFIPLLMGFGCNVPAIMATRTLENERDRILTILINPLMSCSARLPVYILLAGTFFAARAGTVIFGIYVLGIVLAMILGRLFRSTILKGESAPFVMELPPYRLPMLKSLLLHMWDRAKMFLKKMSGIILVGSIVIWFLSSFPQTVTLPFDYETAFADLSGQYETAIAATDDKEKAAALTQEYELEIARLSYQQEAQIRERSYLGRMGKALSPVFEPLGFDWRGTVAIISGFVAKEVVVSTLAVLHGSEDDPDSANLSEALVRSGMTPLAGLAMMAFVLLYVPCFATVAMVLQETRSWQWTGFMVVYSTVLAWIVAFVIFQGGRAMGLG